MLRIPKRRPALPLTLGAGIGLSFSLRAAGIDRPSTIMLYSVVRGSGLRSFAFSRLRRRTPDPSEFSGKPLPRRARDRAARTSLKPSFRPSRRNSSRVIKGDYFSNLNDDNSRSPFSTYSMACLSAGSKSLAFSNGDSPRSANPAKDGSGSAKTNPAPCFILALISISPSSPMCSTWVPPQGVGGKSPIAIRRLEHESQTTGAQSSDRPDGDSRSVGTDIACRWMPVEQAIPILGQFKAGHLRNGATGWRGY